MHSQGINGEGELRGNRLTQIHLENSVNTVITVIVLFCQTVKPHCFDDSRCEHT